jgi:hypothetical protein
MWTFIAGCLMTYIFENLVVELYRSNFSNKDISIVGITIGWLIQEHIRNDFNLTGGKRFMVSRDFRGQFLTNVLKVIRNMFFWIQSITFFEFSVSVSILFFFLIYYTLVHSVKNISCDLILKYFTNLNALLNYEIKKIKFNNIILMLTVIFLFFITKPFFIVFIDVHVIFTKVWLLYISFILINNNFKILGSGLKFFYFKFSYYLLYNLVFASLIINLINFENLKNGNFFQELSIKLYFFLDIILDM